MYKHLLLPTDGSPATASAIQSALQFAREAGARITALHVMPEYHMFSIEPVQLDETREAFMRDTSEQASKLLEALAQKAQAMGVPCETISLRSDQPYRNIVETAVTRGCDLITMATHGNSGLKGILLGSQTHKVLLKSRVPVLVFHAETDTN
ncbi:universal stress protein [Pseudoduganella ginsengisoli]|uniref:Universal stress protein n=1 Tax=Pseudoduganella ginsengisoli TaxID=1462440 RepID=A0A6L6Q5F2_9BURK|nr:universal stress protein [Pseudoduganella ginsengisoli]MTW04511.1 universal stress protein [Pseudoduganella ginsengisoli]